MGSLLRNSRYILTEIQFGVRGMLVVPFTAGSEARNIPYSEEDGDFAGTELEKDVKIKIFEEIAESVAEDRSRRGEFTILVCGVARQGWEKGTDCD